MKHLPPKTELRCLVTACTEHFRTSQAALTKSYGRGRSMTSEMVEMKLHFVIAAYVLTRADYTEISEAIGYSETHVYKLFDRLHLVRDSPEFKAKHEAIEKLYKVQEDICLTAIEAQKNYDDLIINLPEPEPVTIGFLKKNRGTLVEKDGVLIVYFKGKRTLK